jgi:hypothetical protein
MYSSVFLINCSHDFHDCKYRKNKKQRLFKFNLNFFVFYIYIYIYILRMDNIIQCN